MDGSQARQAGWRIGAWCRAVGISRSTYYTLPPDLRPPNVKIGKSHIVREDPGAYLARIAHAQHTETLP